MSARKFGSAAKAAAARAERDEGDYLEYEVLDKMTKFYNPGTAALVHMSMMQAALDGGGSEMKRGITAVVPFIQFVTSLVDEDDAARMRRLLATEGSGFDIMDMMEVFDALMEDWSHETPTLPASDSSGTRATTGKRSTATSRRAGSTRSTSRSPASSTRSTPTS
jgi:hypothetical protein